VIFNAKKRQSASPVHQSSPVIVDDQLKCKRCGKCDVCQMDDCGGCNFVKIELSLVDQTNSNNVASSGDASTEISVKETVH